MGESGHQPSPRSMAACLAVPPLAFSGSGPPTWQVTCSCGGASSGLMGDPASPSIRNSREDPRLNLCAELLDRLRDRPSALGAYFPVMAFCRPEWCLVVRLFVLVHRNENSGLRGPQFKVKCMRRVIASQQTAKIRNVRRSHRVGRDGSGEELDVDDGQQHPRYGQKGGGEDCRNPSESRHKTSKDERNAYPNGNRQSAPPPNVSKDARYGLESAMGGKRAFSLGLPPLVQNFRCNRVISRRRILHALRCALTLR